MLLIMKLQLIGYRPHTSDSQLKRARKDLALQNEETTITTSNTTSPSIKKERERTATARTTSAQSVSTQERSSMLKGTKGSSTPKIDK